MQINSVVKCAAKNKCLPQNQRKIEKLMQECTGRSGKSLANGSSTVQIQKELPGCVVDTTTPAPYPQHAKGDRARMWAGRRRWQWRGGEGRAGRGRARREPMANPSNRMAWGMGGGSRGKRGLFEAVQPVEEVGESTSMWRSGEEDTQGWQGHTSSGVSILPVSFVYSG